MCHGSRLPCRLLYVYSLQKSGPRPSKARSRCTQASACTLAMQKAKSQNCGYVTKLTLHIGCPRYCIIFHAQRANLKDRVVIGAGLLIFSLCVLTVWAKRLAWLWAVIHWWASWPVWFLHLIHFTETSDTAEGTLHSVLPPLSSTAPPPPPPVDSQEL